MVTRSADPARHPDAVRRRQRLAIGLVAEGVDAKTTQGVSVTRTRVMTLDHYAQVVTEQGRSGGTGDGPAVVPPDTAR